MFNDLSLLNDIHLSHARITCTGSMAPAGPLHTAETGSTNASWPQRLRTPKIRTVSGVALSRVRLNAGEGPARFTGPWLCRVMLTRVPSFAGIREFPEQMRNVPHHCSVHVKSEPSSASISITLDLSAVE